MKIKISTTTGIEIKKLIDGIPEFDPTSIEEIQKRIAGRTITLFTAKNTSEISGFIVAYENSPKVYYNWLTGVLPDCRGKSTASKLFETFEKFAKQKGYETCRVKSMNKFGIMLHLFAKFNYVVVGNDGEKIVFEKNI